MKLFSYFLIIWYALSFFATYPNHLSYFNELAPKPYEVIRGSNLDWGQGYVQLQEWMKKNNCEQMELRYRSLTITDPTFYDIYGSETDLEDREVPFTGKVYAISLNRIDEFSWTEKTPREIVGPFAIYDFR